MDSAMVEQVRSGSGFFAALDQSGGSTPKALAEYGVSESAYSDETQMFDLVHAMRTRVITSSAFDRRVLAAILFEQTVQRPIEGLPTAEYLWSRKGVVPFLKVDEGLADQDHGVQLMKPINGLEARLDLAAGQPVLGTKMRSVIKAADPDGVAQIADQQFAYAGQIAAAGLVPIIEPEVSIDIPDKAEAEDLLLDALRTRLAAWPASTPIMFKLTIPSRPDHYAELAADPRVLRLLALSGGYSRDRACALLAENSTMIASFSRALLEGLTAQQSQDEFDRALDHSVAEIAAASIGAASIGA